MQQVVVTFVEIEEWSMPPFTTIKFRGIVSDPYTWDNNRWVLNLEVHDSLLTDESRVLECVKEALYSRGICSDRFKMTWSYDAISTFKDIFTGWRDDNGTEFRKHKSRGFFGD